MLLKDTRGVKIFKYIKGFFASILLKISRIYRRFKDAKNVFAGTLLKTIEISRGFKNAKSFFGTLFGFTKNLDIPLNPYSNRVIREIRGYIRTSTIVISSIIKRFAHLVKLEYFKMHISNSSLYISFSIVIYITVFTNYCFQDLRNLIIFK